MRQALQRQAAPCGCDVLSHVGLATCYGHEPIRADRIPDAWVEAGRRGESFISSKQTRDRCIAERKPCSRGPNDKGTAIKLSRFARGDCRVRVHVALRSAGALDAVRMSAAA